MVAVFNSQQQPELPRMAEKFLGLDVTARLSRAALEALSIIAYRQPVTRPEIDSVRGVNSDGVLRSLLNKGLVQEVGRADAPGRPILYGYNDRVFAAFRIGFTSETTITGTGWNLLNRR